MSESRLVSQKLMRCGYTTGSCAAAAAKAAVLTLLTQSALNRVEIETPDGQKLTIDIVKAEFDAATASCAVKKDSGDDPDVTNGATVVASVAKLKSGIAIDGGKGVGRVTKPGLDQPVGAAAINSVPRRMIGAEVLKACRACGYEGGVSVVISVPGGEEIAARTFNSSLGIVGGLSILGTSGIVEPMSSAALVGTIRAALKVLRATGEKRLLLTPGNYGWRFAEEIMRLKPGCHVKCGNNIGETLAAASELGFSSILLVSHIGKLVKLGIGVTNTHSSHGDGRRETLIACALRAGAPRETLLAIDSCATTDAAVEALRQSGYLNETMKILGRLIGETLKRQVLPETQAGYICFLGGEVLAQSENAAALTKIFRE